MKKTLTAAVLLCSLGFFSSAAHASVIDNGNGTFTISTTAWSGSGQGYIITGTTKAHPSTTGFDDPALAGGSINNSSYTGSYSIGTYDYFNYYCHQFPGNNQCFDPSIIPGDDLTAVVGTEYFTATYSGSGAATINPKNLSNISSQSFSTSTFIYNVKGFWVAGTTELDAWQSDQFLTHQELELLGSTTTAPIIATTTGSFDLSFNVKDSSIAAGETSTEFTLDPNRTLHSALLQIDPSYTFFPPNGTAPFEIDSAETGFIASTSQFYTPQNDFTNATLGTTTLPSATNFLSFLNVPQLLATKIPFAYFFQGVQTLQNGLQSSTTIPIPTGTFSIKGLGNGSTTVDMFSTSTVAYYISPSLTGFLRTFMLAFLYVEFLYALYHRAKAQHLI